MLNPFASKFRACATDVRRRIALRDALAGATLGGSAAVPLTTLAWAMGHAAWAPALLVAPLVGGALGLARALYKPWSDLDAALYLDAQLHTSETLATAVALPASAAPDARDTVLLRASEALDGLRPSHLPRVLRRHHGVIPAAVGFIALCCLAPALGSSHTASATTLAASTLVRVESAPGLVTVERLRTLSPRDPEQHRRLEALAAQARQLREELQRGTTPERARNALRSLEDALRRERESLGDGRELQGLQRAAATLRQQGLEEAAQALEHRDLEALDQAMERLANSREATDRRRARESIQQAADAAREAGAEQVAQALEEENDLLHQRAQRNSLLRRLAEQLAHEEPVRRAAEHLERERTDAAARDLAAAMERALAALSADERQRLAERMREALRHAQSPSRDEHREPPDSDENGDENGDEQSADSMTAEQLEQMLREAANESPEGSEGSQSSQGRGSTRPGGRGGLPIPMMMPGGSSAREVQRALDRAARGTRQASAQASANGAQGPQGSGTDERDGSGGVSRGGGPGSHNGSTDATRSNDLRANAHGPLRAGANLPGVMGRTRAGTEASRVLRTGDLQGVGPAELQGVERSDIPAEYRNQVRVYFQP